MNEFARILNAIEGGDFKAVNSLLPVVKMPAIQKPEKIFYHAFEGSASLSPRLLLLGSIVSLLTFMAGCTPVSRNQPKALQGNYVLTLPNSHYTLSIPEDGLSQRNAPPGASADNPRTFFFKDEANHLSILVFFRPAQYFTGVEDFWEKVTTDREQKNLPQPLNVMFAEVLNWHAVFYDDVSPRMYCSQIRAHEQAGGIWIDVHLSMTSDREDVNMRPKLLRLLKKMDVQAYRPTNRGVYARPPQRYSGKRGD